MEVMATMAKDLQNQLLRLKQMLIHGEATMDMVDMVVTEVTEDTVDTEVMVDMDIMERDLLVLSLNLLLLLVLMLKQMLMLGTITMAAILDMQVTDMDMDMVMDMGILTVLTAMVTDHMDTGDTTVKMIKNTDGHCFCSSDF